MTTPATVATSDSDAEQRRQALEQALVVGLLVWLAFFGLDVFVVEFLHSRGGLLWFGALRVIGAVPIAVCWLVVRRRDLRPIFWTIAELGAFTSATAVVSVMAIRHGGLDSHYIIGILYVIMYHAAAMPERWLRSLVAGLVMAASYPLVMAVAALVDPVVARDWRTPATVWFFVHDYLFVLASALLGSAASHMVWAARKQVFEARKLGRYRLKARIGAGGMGEVWLARDERGGRDVALKILDGSRSRGRTAVARFEREARAAAQLRSRNAIRVYDLGASDDGVWYIAMELLDGLDLGVLVREHGALPPGRVLHLLRQACASLAEAHEHGIIHRDIKPGNLFVTRQPTPDLLKLLDFGIAKLTTDQTLTQVGWMAGTPEYMAPEAQRSDAGTTSDIYSLGAVGYFLLTGTPPFQCESAIETLLAHREELPEPPSARRPGVPKDLEAVLLRCLAKDPVDRYLDVAELDRALAQCREAQAWTEADAAAFWVEERRQRLQKTA